MLQLHFKDDTGEKPIELWVSYMNVSQLPTLVANYGHRFHHHGNCCGLSFVHWICIQSQLCSSCHFCIQRNHQPCEILRIVKLDLILAYDGVNWRQIFCYLSRFHPLKLYEDQAGYDRQSTKKPVSHNKFPPQATCLELKLVHHRDVRWTAYMVT